MKNLLPAVVTTGILLMSPLILACEIADRVKIPNGLTATEKEMIAADAKLQAYMAEMLEYQSCIEEETRKLRVRSSNTSKAVARSREDKAIRDHNKASSAMEKTAENFNNAVADYQSRS